MKTDYDLIVIGSGIGGLTAASILSKSRRILVLEKNRTYGGYCSDFVRDGYRFESAVQAINGLYETNPVYAILEKADAMRNVSLRTPENLYRAIFPGRDITVPQKDLKRYVEQLAGLFPDEQQGLCRLVSTMKAIYHEMHRFYAEKTTKKSPYLLRYCRRSLQELMDEHIKSRELQAIISQYWMYRGLPPSKLSSITFSYIWYDYTAFGSYYPEGGMRSMVSNLVAMIRSNGSDVKNRKKVVRIKADRSGVKSVVLDDGTKISAHAVVSNIDVFKTFEYLDRCGNEEIDSFIGKLEQNTLSISACKIYLGLSQDAQGLGLREYETFINPSYDPDALHEASVHNEFEKMPYCITAYSNISDSFCSKGQGVISIGLLSGYDFWRALSSRDYAKAKERLLSVMLDRCESIIPDIRKYIRTEVVATPLTMERYTGNSRGAIYGWNKKSLIDEMRFINPTTPVKNLYLSSHWTKMGGGIGGVLLASDRVCDFVNFVKDQ